MASTFSPTLRLELIGDGDQSGIWGQTTNNNLGALIEQAITGVITISMTDANYTLANFNGVVDEARNQVIVLTGTLSVQRNLIAPLVEKTYAIKNTTTGGFGVQIIGASGTGVTIPNGTTASVFCDGSNFFPATTGSLGNQVINGNLAVTGTTTLTGALSASTATFSGAISSVNPSFTGTPTAPTAIAGTNTTQIATTAFVQNVAGALGTMSTQNANNVNITGGVITGSYGLTAAAATNPASGGSFITSSNIGSQSVNFANSAGNGGVTSLNGQTGAITNTSINSIGSYFAGGTLTLGDYNAGDTVAGSSLRMSGISNVFGNFGNTNYNAGLSGTWRAMGRASSYNDKGNLTYNASLWCRVS